MTIKEAKDKNNMLSYMLPAVKDILSDYIVYEEQRTCLENFCIDIIAIADAENSYAENMLRIMANKMVTIK
jgi:hypothetical protein